jgi:hypothetical protein
MPVVSHASVRAPIQHTVDLVDHEVTTDTFAESAGLLLVDPWVLAQPQGRQRLMRTLKVLPSWAPPVVLADQNDPQYHPHGVHHVEDAIRLCNATCPGANERRDIPDAEAFDVLIPYWVNFSYRRFRDRPTSRARKSYGRRPRLGDPFRDGEGSATDD